MNDSLSPGLAAVVLAGIAFVIWRAVRRWNTRSDLLQMFTALAVVGGVIGWDEGGLGQAIGTAASLSFFGTLFYWTEREAPEHREVRRAEPTDEILRLGRYGNALAPLTLALAVVVPLLYAFDVLGTPWGIVAQVLAGLTFLAMGVLIVALRRAIKRAPRRELGGEGNARRTEPGGTDESLEP